MVTLRLPVNFKNMFERIFEAKGAPMSRVAIHPSDHLIATGLNFGDTRQQGRFRGSPIGNMRHTGGVMPGQFQTMMLIIIKGAQIGTRCILLGEREPINAREKIQTGVKLICVKLYMPQMCDIIHPPMPPAASIMPGVRSCLR